MKPSSRRWIGPLAIALLMLTGAGYVLWTSHEAREIVTESVFLLFTVFTTPFILETSVALMGLAAVITYNQWRLSREGDEWVEMEVSDVKEPTEPK
ncbi:MAG: hypothetical protein ACOYOF_14995 [Verrucomicrobiaceae bacterium]